MSKNMESLSDDELKLTLLKEGEKDSSIEAHLRRLQELHKQARRHEQKKE